jgi:hypothetical protein
LWRRKKNKDYNLQEGVKEEKLSILRRMGANTERESKPNTKFLSLIFFFFQLQDHGLVQVLLWFRQAGIMREMM